MTSNTLNKMKLIIQTKDINTNCKKKKKKCHIIIMFNTDIWCRRVDNEEAIRT